MQTCPGQGSGRLGKDTGRNYVWMSACINMEIDRSKYKVWDSNNLNIIHWMINPGLAINELILGQRIPRITLIDQTSDKPLMERTYIPCPNCKTYHDGRTWSAQNKTALKNWFGLYCHNCNEIIPCIRNWTSGLILILTYPFWFWWINSWKRSWMDKQPQRFSNLSFEAIEHKKVNWLKTGLVWGAFMFITMTLLMPLITGTEYDLTIILINLPIWTIGGVAFGYTMKWWMGKRLKNADQTDDSASGN